MIQIIQFTIKTTLSTGLYINIYYTCTIKNHTQEIFYYTMYFTLTEFNVRTTSVKSRFLLHTITISVRVRYLTSI